MGRRKQSRGTSADSVEQDESANQVTTRSGKRVLSDSSPVKEQTKSPVLRSNSKRDSSEFDTPAPKRLSAFAQRKISCGGDSGDVLIMGKNQSRKTRGGSEKDVTMTEELGSNEATPAKITPCKRGSRRSSGRQTGGNVQKQAPHDAKKTTTARNASNTGPVEGSGEKIVASNSKNAQQVNGEASSPYCSARESGSSGRATRQAASVASLSRGSEDLPEFLATMDVSAVTAVDTAPRDVVSTGTDQAMILASTTSLCIFPLSDPDEWVVVLSHPQEVFLRGKAYVRSIHGHVAIHGYLVKPGAPRRPVYSPECSSMLAIGTVPLEAPSGDHRETVRASLGNESAVTVECIVEVVDADSVVLVFSRLDCHMCRYVQSFKQFTQLFTGPSNQSTAKQVGTLDLTISGRETQELRMTYDEDYKHVVRQYCDQVTKGVAPVVVICGGKNVGKSALTRYIINYVLNSYDKVAYLECDVGQTEFTPSCCPALSVITEPLLGPPFTHRRKPHRWSYFGGLSPGAKPMDYLRCLRYAYNSYARMDNKPPLVVNTMGWNKGLGIGLMVETVRMVQPELIIQINSTRLAKNFPTLSREFINNDRGLNWSNSPVKRDAIKTEHDLVVLTSPVSPTLDGHEKYRLKDLRNLMLLTYFGQMQPVHGPAMNLAELQPFSVPWSAMGLHICNGVVDNSQVMLAFNGSVVALCIADEKMMHRSRDPTYPKFFYENPVCQGVGFGIVRNIDSEKRVFHIITPVPHGELEKVNCLLMGDLELPEQLRLQQKLEGQIPYVGNPINTVGATSTKKRRHLCRQKQGNQR